MISRWFDRLTSQIDVAGSIPQLAIPCLALVGLGISYLLGIAMRWTISGILISLLDWLGRALSPGSA